MLPSRTSETPSLVFFTYKRKKVAFARTGTRGGAVNPARTPFTVLKEGSPGRIGISARLPHQEQGVLEIAPEAWQLATSGLEQFTLGSIDGEPEAEQVEGIKEEKEEEGDAIVPYWGSGPSQTSFAGDPTASQSGAPHQPAEGHGFWINARYLHTRNDRISGLHPSNSIYTLKAKIQEPSGIPIDDQRLVFAGVRPEEARTLADYSITEGVTVHVVLHLRRANLS